MNSDPFPFIPGPVLVARACVESALLKELSHEPRDRERLRFMADVYQRILFGNEISPVDYLAFSWDVPTEERERFLEMFA